MADESAAIGAGVSATTDRLIGERMARAAVVYNGLKMATARLDAAKSALPKDSPLAVIGCDQADQADFYVYDRYLQAIDTATSWAASYIGTMNRAADILEKAKP